MYIVPKRFVPGVAARFSIARLTSLASVKETATETARRARLQKAEV